MYTNKYVELQLQTRVMYKRWVYFCTFWLLYRTSNYCKYSQTPIYRDCWGKGNYPGKSGIPVNRGLFYNEHL